jgi:aminoglycoside phosphotransferase (APT) family kinase protein
MAGGRQTSDSHERYRVWLDELHGRLVTPNEVIAEAVARAVGARPAAKERITLGEVNEVYRVEASNGERVIVRVSHGSRRHRGETWAIERCREAGVPTPEVLAVEDVELDGREGSICIQRQIEGTPLDHLMASLPEAEIHRLVEEAGRILARIHSVRTEGSGYIGPDGRGTARGSVAEEVLSLEEEPILAAASKVGVETTSVERLIAELRDNIAVFQGIEARLIHGDYGGKHLLVDGGKIVGVIDFEDCASIDPAADFAWWEFWYEPSVPVEVLIRGYEREADLGEAFEERRRLLKIRLTLGILPYLADRDHPAIHHWFRNLEDDLARVAANG